MEIFSFKEPHSKNIYKSTTIVSLKMILFNFWYFMSEVQSWWWCQNAIIYCIHAKYKDTYFHCDVHNAHVVLCVIPSCVMSDILMLIILCCMLSVTRGRRCYPHRNQLLSLLDVGIVYNWYVIHYVLNASVHGLWSIKRDIIADRYVYNVYVFYQMN